MKKLVTSLGLMSGTSADGIDAAVLVTDGDSHLQSLGGISIPYDEAFRLRLIAAASTDQSDKETGRLEQQLTQLHGQAAQEICQELKLAIADIDVIGFHGHTIRHKPDEMLTWQIGDGGLLTKITGRPVVFDFRSLDVAMGGQGAPLASLYHQAIVGDRPGTHVVLNLGGVANITWISGESIAAGDTGPGCGLVDLLVQSRLGQPFDRDGKLALAGTVDRDVVQNALSSIPYFEKPIPKSADRYEFDSINVDHLSDADAAATLCAITVESVAEAVERLPTRPDHCWVTGGGRRHPVMMEMLSRQFDHVASISELGHDPDLLEAAVLLGWRYEGWLANQLQCRRRTGVSEPVSGGRIVS